MKVEELWVYPIKSCAGHSVAEVSLDPTGFQHDRLWMLVSPTGAFISQRQIPQLACIEPKISPPHLILSFAETGTISIPIEPQGEAMSVSVWDDTVLAQVVSKDADQWFSNALKRPCRLVKLQDPQARIRKKTGFKQTFPVSFADGAPVLLTNKASLRELARNSDTEIEMNRFRPNIVVDFEKSFCEEGWQGLRGPSASFAFSYPCVRCPVINTNQHSGAVDKAVLRTLVNYRKENGMDPRAVFGIRLIPGVFGRIQVGQDIQPVTPQT
jgi:uncharacterized protein YcbX